MGSHWFFTRHRNTYIYVPNIIGYLRILCSLYAFAVALRSPATCVVVYFAGFICDELDGRFARSLNQTSTLGSVLDMVTDRLSTAGLLTILCILYPRAHFVFLPLLMLDIFSHWFQTCAALVSGSSTHKDVHSRSFIVRFYYKSRIFMGFCCICCEVLYLALYLQNWPQFQRPHLFTLRPPHILQPLAAEIQFMPKGWEAGFDVSPAAIVAGLAIPGVVIKQFINLQQLRMAMQLLVDFDRTQDVRAGPKTPAAQAKLAALDKIH